MKIRELKNEKLIRKIIPKWENEKVVTEKMIKLQNKKKREL